MMPTPTCPFEALEQATLWAPRARRNMEFGLWAGRRLGLGGAELAAFADRVMLADHAEPGDADVLDHVGRDLERGGVAVLPAELRRRLLLIERQVFRDLADRD
jgi:hypothetical protein